MKQRASSQITGRSDSFALIQHDNLVVLTVGVVQTVALRFITVVVKSEEGTEETETETEYNITSFSGG